MPKAAVDGAPPLGGARAAAEARLFGRRTRLVVVASTAYAAASAIYGTRGVGARAWVAAAIALAIAWGAGERDRWTGLAAWGVALTFVASGVDHAALRADLPSGAPGLGGWVGALGLAAALGAAIAARVAIARVQAPAGIATAKPKVPLVGLSFLIATTAIALGLRARGLAHPGGPLDEDGRTIELVALAAAWAAIGVACWITSRLRRLELGVAARMQAATGLVIASAIVTAAAKFLDLGAAAPMARVGLAVASFLVASVALYGDPVDLARASRRAIALVIVGGPIVMLGAIAAEGNAGGGAVVAVIGVIALAIGMAAPWLEEPLRPARGAWLDAVAAAHEALLRTDPDEAIREALVALRAPAGLDAPSPELWIFDPMRATRVDAAAYAHTTDGALPAGLVATAAAEPEAILRHEVLDAFQVRRAELRPFVRWMDDHGAMLVAVVTRAGEAEGLLVLPRGRRAEALSLEEARAIKRLADALAALCHARAALARSLDRERLATVRADGAEGSLARANEEIERRAGIHVLAAERLARPATVGIYSAVARFAWDAIEAAVRAGRTLFVHAPSGVDAIPYVARAHLGGPRRGEPLVVVDGTSSREHDPERWLDPLASPLALAHRGLLLLVDGAALPHDVQRTIARACAERRAPWDEAAPLDLALAMTGSSELASLVASSRLAPALAARFDDCATASLPRLRDRPEDLRAIVSDRLAREGLRARGAPVGIDDAAFARFLDFPFDGEEAELASLAQKLVAACDGDVVRGKHVDAVLAADPALRRDIA